MDWVEMLENIDQKQKITSILITGKTKLTLFASPNLELASLEHASLLEFFVDLRSFL